MSEDTYLTIKEYAETYNISQREVMRRAGKGTQESNTTQFKNHFVVEWSDGSISLEHPKKRSLFESLPSR